MNLDTGNYFLAGGDPVVPAGLLGPRTLHVHAKDISAEHAKMRGKVTGTRGGVAMGGGVIDLRAFVRALFDAGFVGRLTSVAHRMRYYGTSMGLITYFNHYP